jgi:hypothetical protein
MNRHFETPQRLRFLEVASAAPLPQPMLARSGSIPTRGDYAYEVKWDDFRGLLRTENVLRLRSRRGWDTTSLCQNSRRSRCSVCPTVMKRADPAGLVSQRALERSSRVLVAEGRGRPPPRPPSSTSCSS